MADHADAPSAPIIVSALMGAEDFAWFDGLRRANFPPGRNHLPAHLTLFHHLPPSVEPELRRRLSQATMRKRPLATTSKILNLGKGVAIGVESPELDAIRGELADVFNGLLIPQDAAGWRPHITIQNKVPPAEAKMLFSIMEKGFRPRSVQICGLAAWWYRGGPWELISRHMFH